MSRTSRNASRAFGAMPEPIITQQATVEGDLGEVVRMVIAEVLALDHDDSGPFRGLGDFIRAERPQFETPADRALVQLTRELRHKARRLGADAVVTMRFSTAEIATGACELVAYGTAVKLRRG